MQKSRLKFLAVATAAMTALSAFTSQANAAYMPVGVQQNVPTATVSGGGWSVAYSGAYGLDNVSLAPILASIPAGSMIMYAARQNNSTTYTLLAAALDSDVLTYTPLDTTHNANGVAWYYNGGSMGFAPGGASISQNSADIVDSVSLGGGNTGGTGDFRLSWHTSGPSGYGAAPDVMHGGWRVGSGASVEFLNSEPTGWTREILYAPAPVPEPSTYLAGALLALVFGVQGFRSLRNRKQTA